MHNATHDGTNTFSFRGRSMQEAVHQLKEQLGVDAVIVSTRRGSDKQGPFVEISARVGNAGRTPAAPSPKTAVGGAKRVTNAYAQTALKTQPSALGSVLANLTAGDTDDKPFAQRAAWLASQIKQREQQHSVAAQSTTMSHGLPPELMALRDGALPRGHEHVVAQSDNHSVVVDKVSPPWSQPGTNPQPATVSQPQAPTQVQSNIHDNYPAPSQNRRYIEHDADVLHRDARQNQETEQELLRLRAELADLKTAVAELSRPESQTQSTTISGEQLSAAMSSLDDRLGEIRNLLERPEPPRSVKKTKGLISRLIDLGFNERHAEAIAQRMDNALPGAHLEDGDFRDTLKSVIADDLLCGGSLATEQVRQRIMAFVGPTGVGKTTTIAKVASEACFEGMRVALITVDTFRMAAVEQLARYAQVLNAPLRIARDSLGLQSAIKELSDYDLILIDTTGRSPRAQDQVRALAEIFPSGWGGELVLTLSCGSRDRDIYAAVEAYGSLGIERLCMTKMDETDALGVIYSASKYAHRPLAWVTCGQQVPDDIETASADKLAAQIVHALTQSNAMALAV